MTFTLPKTLPWSMWNGSGMSKGDWELQEDSIESDTLGNHIDGFYLREVGFGFRYGMRLQTGTKTTDPSQRLIIVKHLSGNSWGTNYSDAKHAGTPDWQATRWIIMRTDYFPSMERAIDHLLGKEEVPKGKRKPRRIQPMTDEELIAGGWVAQPSKVEA